MNDTTEKFKKIKILFSVAAVVLVICLVKIMFGENGLYELNQLQQELAEMKVENTRLEKENISLYRTINRLKNDPGYIEHIARQELQMIGEDEIVFKFQQQSRDEKKSGLSDTRPQQTP